ncbi:DUF3489 domain-containing protein [Enterovirga aerilata]|uniref:DUF3489 domain-containing protein n=1 Tax=Enterovirga aerilata TaxID=2730920 RepID=A0A849IJD2_9HYPH|nr:DUF3489 domain-containing protein [Enterovirga sp. DB1703]NNM74053.1 DUF3489 domain-containing protein [Enterovirga sp. DB1703]
MTTITLSKTETTILLAAAERGGAIEIPESMKPVTRQRLMGRFERDGLIRAGEGRHVLTPVGYRAVGLRPPRQRRVEDGTPRPASKQTLILELLGRAEGASIAELMNATGWLPHTTRAALSRLRSAGTPLLKSSREDGTAAYRIVTEEPAAPKRRSRSRPVEGVEAALA